ncbi:hypothetical protein HG536_0D00340 [Torulaspora globosa]|uniref:Uncharacterized protein n=1 Tax=Torulaspora globosa TaxID=48254 RepID=A0A7G3ZG76_9SACH|nr:uncharacterized protein HG536_0D00340 [Torulaspora globosa]QLL32512.1 hypothetical protein HG536_0D00340 [Torulaspora globosa]
MADIKKLAASCVSAVVEEEDESEEERFDYTDSEGQDQDDSMLTVAGSPRRIKPWSFMDTFNPKKQALAIAREIDAKKGIKLELPPKPQPPPSDAATGESSTLSTIRRVPSGAKPPPSGHNLRASTPVEAPLENGASSNEHDQSIGEVAGQSTPLTLAKITSGKPREVQDDVIGVSKSSSQPTEDELISGLRRETMLLKDEISKLKAQVVQQNSIQAERDNQLKAMSKALEDRKNELEAVKMLQQSKDSQISSAMEQLDEVKRLLEVSERNRIQESETNGIMVKNLRDEISRKDDLIEEARKRLLEVEERHDQRREKLETTIDELKERINSEREAAFNELRTSNSEWQKRLDDKEAKLVAITEEYESEYRKKLSKAQDDLSARMDELHNVQKELKEKCNELEHKNSIIENAKKSYDELQSQHTSIKEELKMREENVEQLQKQLKNARSSQEELESSNGKAIKKLEAHIDQLESDLKRLRQLQKTLQSDTNQYKEKLQTIEKQNNELTRELQRSKSARNDLQSEVAELMRKLQLANTDNERLQNNEQLLKSSESQLRNELCLIRENLRNANDVNNKLQDEMQALKNEAELYRKENKEKLGTALYLNEQLKKEVESLTESRDGLEKEQKDIEAQLQESLKEKERLKALYAEANEIIKELRRSFESVQEELHEEQQAHENTTKNAHKIEEYSEDLSKFIENLTLFDLHIGSIMLHTFKKDHQITCFDPFLTAKNTDVVGFHCKSHDRKHHDLEKKVEHLNLKNQELLSQIENQWKILVESQKREISQQKRVIDGIEAKSKELDNRCQERELRCEKLQDEKAMMLKEKDELIQEKMALTNQISALKGSTMTDEQKKINHLVEQIEEVTGTISVIREQVRAESAENIRLKATIENKEAQLKDLQNKLKDQVALLQHQEDLENLLKDNRNELSNLQEICDRQQVDIEEKTYKLQKLQGDDSKSITFHIARQSRPDITKDLYDKLMISQVDSIDMVELQNIVKNLILLLEIPFNKLTKKVPLVAMYLKYERPIFSHFANRLHFDVFNEAIDMKRFTNEAYDQYTETHNMAAIKHPLEACLENLYQRLVSRL